MEKIFFEAEDGNKQELYVYEETMLEGIKYLLVSDGDPTDEEALAYIFKEISEENEEVIYEPVEDERELAALSGIFNELLDDEDISIE